VTTAWTSILVMTVWAAGLVISCSLGLLLSQLTLREARTAGVGKGMLFVRSIYHVVIAIVSLCYYLAIPVVVLSVAAVTGGIVYEILVGGRIPVYVILFAGFGAIVTLFFVGSSVFVSVEDPVSGRAVSEREAPRLWSVTTAVARRLNTRRVDSIVVTPGTEIAVTELGGTLQILRGKGRRCLLLGLGVLPGLRRGPFEALLAHEYGHFSAGTATGSCACGPVAHQARLSLDRNTLKVVIDGQDKWYNPLWWFLAAFDRVFSRITLGASRLQELLADVNAAQAFGVSNFTEGLEHTIRQSIVFSTQVSKEIELSQREGRRIQNVYTLQPPDDEHQLREIEQKFIDVMERSVSPDDSHPPARDRIALLQRLGAETPVERNSEPVWDLLDNAGELQDEMTDLYQASIDDHRHARQTSNAAMDHPADD
jgi:Zn-dependent protease with chaperone function